MHNYNSWWMMGSEIFRYVRQISAPGIHFRPISADKNSMFALASSCENPRWVQEVESRGGMTRKEWADFVDRNFNPPK